MKYTVLGGTGFIGSHLVLHLQKSGNECFVPNRIDPAIFETNLGHVIYSIGVTADFRERPYDTVNAHVCYLFEILEKSKYESFTYLSSTRIYRKIGNSNEKSILKVCPFELDDIYNISKIMGESICFNSKHPNIKVIRLSNVYGNDISSTNFLPSIIRDAFIEKNILLRTTLKSEKDYVYIKDVVNLIPKIIQYGKNNIYNVASGINVSNQEIIHILQQATSCSVEVAQNAEEIADPKISIKQIQDEFAFVPTTIKDLLINILTEVEPGVTLNDKNRY